MSEPMSFTSGIFIPNIQQKDSSLSMYEVPLPETTLEAIERANLRPVHNLDEIALLMRERSFGLFKGFAVVSSQTFFGVHMDYVHSQDGTFYEPIFSLQIIPHEVLSRMSEYVRGHIITCVNDVKRLRGNFSLFGEFLVEKEVPTAA